MNRFAVLAMLFSAFCSPLAIHGLDPLQGTGWTMTRLDLNVNVDNLEPGLSVSGIASLRLDQESSAGPTLWLNSREPAVSWVQVEGEKVARVELGTAEHISEAVRYAAVELLQEAARGDTLELEFELKKTADSGQLVARSDVALASWVEAWYPIPLLDEGLEDAFSAKLISVPGTTTLDLPGTWVGMSDGRLIRREAIAGRTLEVWDLTEGPVARSFAAGPYTWAQRQVQGRVISILLLQEHVLDPDRLADLLAACMAAQEERLGPFPFAGYGVVEVPEDVADWGAASQQTFIMAKSGSFDYEHGNLPLWAHEMSHGWWGNTVGTRGPGRKMAGEALAQFGVLIALEALEGEDAMVNFLELSRSGYSRRQCARGYFQMANQGMDHALATLADSALTGGQTHNLADSKGMWVYHMLRRHIGDEVFFATLRGLVKDYAGKEMSLDDVRAAFLTAAPDRDLEGFFAQWLDRPGAPRIEATWSSVDDGQTCIHLTQTQDGPAFDLDVELELILEDGARKREIVHAAGRETRVILEVPGKVSQVDLDPDRDHLLWRPSYDVGPVVDGEALPPTADWVEPAAYVGTYQVEAMGMSVEVTSDERGLWVEVAGDLRRLYPHKPYVFHTYIARVEFVVEDGVATGFTVELEDGPTAQGVRIE